MGLAGSSPASPGEGIAFPFNGGARVFGVRLIGIIKLVYDADSLTN